MSNNNSLEDRVQLKGMILDVLGLALLSQTYIDLRSIQRLVTQKLLDRDQIRVHGDVMCGEGVAQGMYSSIVNAC